MCVLCCGVCKCEPEGKQLLTDPEINSQMRPDNRHTASTQSTQHPVRYVRDYLPSLVVGEWVCECVYSMNEYLTMMFPMCSVDSIYT